MNDDVIRIEIPGEPVAQGRGRAVPVFGKGGVPKMFTSKKGNQIPMMRVKDPTNSYNWKAVAGDLMKREMEARGLTPLTGPLCVRVICIFSLARSNWRKTKPRPREWSQNSKDVDNLLKAVMDAGNGILWLDDRQVAGAQPWKITGAQGEPGRVIVEVQQLPIDAVEQLDRPMKPAKQQHPSLF
jgi:Holliday junction resolvase RusA-like endonuclease